MVAIIREPAKPLARPYPAQTETGAPVLSKAAPSKFGRPAKSPTVPPPPLDYTQQPDAQTAYLQVVEEVASSSSSGYTPITKIFGAAAAKARASTAKANPPPKASAASAAKANPPPKASAASAAKANPPPKASAASAAKANPPPKASAASAAKANPPPKAFAASAAKANPPPKASAAPNAKVASPAAGKGSTEPFARAIWRMRLVMTHHGLQEPR